MFKVKMNICIAYINTFLNNTTNPYLKYYDKR